MRVALVVAAGVLLSGVAAWLAVLDTEDLDLEPTTFDARTPVSPERLRPEQDLVALEQGRAYYVQLCMACHGSRGDGQGEWAYRVTPKPADLRRDRTRKRSDAELDRMIAEGIPGSPMIGNKLSAAQRQQLAGYVRYLGENRGEPRR
jgi:mono/diheme cytochrome c family protein